MTPRVVHVNPKDPLAYVLSRNLHRRHLTVSQRAMIAARARELFEDQARKRQLAGLKRGDKAPVPANLPERENNVKNTENRPSACPDYHGEARNLAGRAVGVSGRTVDAATRVLHEAPKDVVAAVDAGKLSVSAAVKAIDQAKAPPAEGPKDGDGRPIPERLRGVFAQAGQFEKFAQALSAIKGQVRQAIESAPVAWSAFSENRFRAAIEQATELLRLSGPFLVCCYCGGDQSDKCRACKGAGFLNKTQARCVPQELRRCN